MKCKKSMDWVERKEPEELLHDMKISDICKLCSDSYCACDTIAHEKKRCIFHGVKAYIPDIILKQWIIAIVKELDKEIEFHRYKPNICEACGHDKSIFTSDVVSNCLSDSRKAQKDILMKIFELTEEDLNARL